MIEEDHENKEPDIKRQPRVVENKNRLSDIVISPLFDNPILDDEENVIYWPKLELD